MNILSTPLRLVLPLLLLLFLVLLLRQGWLPVFDPADSPAALSPFLCLSSPSSPPILSFPLNCSPAFWVGGVAWRRGINQQKTWENSALVIFTRFSFFPKIKKWQLNKITILNNEPGKGIEQHTKNVVMKLSPEIMMVVFFIRGN